MLRHRAPLLCALALLLIGAAPPPMPYTRSYVGPSEILFQGADTVYFLRSLQWHSDNARHQEKLLLHGLRMTYWRNHLPPDMRSVFEALGYPTGRVLRTPVGHTEEWWYYGLREPLRFRDGALLDRSLFEKYRAR